MSSNVSAAKKKQQPTRWRVVELVKECGKQKKLKEGIRIHAYILKQDAGVLLNQRDPFVGNSLITMYAKCGCLSKARETFEDIPVHDVVSWNALISAYVGHGQPHKALNCFQHMLSQGCLYPDHVTFLCVLKSCCNLAQILKGREIHANLLMLCCYMQPQNNLLVCNALVDMYAKTGQLPDAQDTFDRIYFPDSISWNSLISAYSEHFYAEDALRCFFQMQAEGLFPDAITLVCVLKACVSIDENYKGVVFHASIFIDKWIEKDIVVGYALVDMYAKKGMLGRSQRVFDELRVKDTGSWNALIGGYIQRGRFKEAFNSFNEMQKHGHSANEVTSLSILKACGHVRDICKGESIHKQLIMEGLLENNVLLGAALVDMYAKCGALVKAKEVFNKLFVRDVVVWNALITGYAEHGFGEEALHCFSLMQNEGLSPDRITFLSVLKACGSIVGTKSHCDTLYTEIEHDESLMGNIMISTALMDMFGKHGALTKVQNLFRQHRSVKNVVTWTALISAYVRHGHMEEAFQCLKQMQLEGIPANAITFVGILKACGDIGSIHKGKEAHTQIVTQGLLEKEAIVGNALVDMYMKCGETIGAHQVFDRVLVKSVDSWNTLISGYAQLGKYETVMNLCNRMIGQGVVPDIITFSLLLSVCSHTGLLDEGQTYFKTMMKIYGIIPSMQHHVSVVVDLFGRSGQVDIAFTLITNVATSVDNISIWVPLLSACHKWGNVELASLVFKHMMQLNECHTASYVCMSNIYATLYNKSEKL